MQEDFLQSIQCVHCQPHQGYWSVEPIMPHTYSLKTESRIKVSKHGASCPQKLHDLYKL